MQPTSTTKDKILRFLSSLLLIELCRGLMLTFRQMFRPKITVQFPEEKTPRSGRFRGLHALRTLSQRRRAVYRL